MSVKVIELELKLKKRSKNTIPNLRTLVLQSLHSPDMKVTKRLKDCSITHRLLDYEGKCRNLHGHTYAIEISIFTDKQGENGITMDFNAFKTIDAWLGEFWDHSCLVSYKDAALLGFLKKEKSNYYIMEGNTTVENMCKELRKVIDTEKFLGDYRYSVKIWETATSSCEL